MAAGATIVSLLNLVHGAHNFRPNSSGRVPQRLIYPVHTLRMLSLRVPFIILTSRMADAGEDQFEDVGIRAESDRQEDSSPPSSPSFAPKGRPMVRKRFRASIPGPLRLDTPRTNRLASFQNSYSVRIMRTTTTLR
jgi:hypothetical protein